MRRGLAVCVLRPAVARRHHHADSRHRHDVAALGEVGMRSRGGGLRYPEALRQGDPARYRVAWWVGACPDFALQYPRDLEVARDSGEVIKIIRHTASLDA